MTLWGWDWAAVGAWVLSFLGIVLAPVAALLGAYIGARIANRNSRQRWRAEKRESRLALARAAAIEVAESSYKWSAAHYAYALWQLGIGNEDQHLSDALGVALTRQAIAFATLYVSVSDVAVVAAARTLESQREPYQMFLGDDAVEVLDKVGAARTRSLARLVIGKGDFDKAVREYIQAIAPLLASVPEE